MLSLYLPCGVQAVEDAWARLPQTMGKPLNSRAFSLLLLLCPCYRGQQPSGTYDYDYDGNSYGGGDLPEPPAPPPSTPPLTPVQKMQLKQCVTTADGQVRSVSIPVGKTLHDPRIQKRFERMFKSPMVLPGTVSTSEVDEECVACSGRC